MKWLNWLKLINWRKISVLKPLAVCVTIWACATVTLAVCIGHDIGTGTASMAEAIIYICVGGYFGTSAYEAVRTPTPIEDKEDS